ncbi:hypothetical protein KR215_009585, partial [Drosophila sulfurigaster]
QQEGLPGQVRCQPHLPALLRQGRRRGPAGPPERQRVLQRRDQGDDLPWFGEPEHRGGHPGGSDLPGHPRRPGPQPPGAGPGHRRHRRPCPQQEAQAERHHGR